MLLLVFSTIVLAVVLVVIAALTHFYVVVAISSVMFHGRVSYRNFPKTGPLQCLQDWKILLSFDFFYV